MTREEAIQFLDNMKHEEAGKAIGNVGFFAELMGYHVEALNMAIKALEQEPKTGHWYYDEEREATGIYAICSNCDEKIYQTGDFKYCPNCGAKMESEG